jgi:hypothetical protein
MGITANWLEGDFAVDKPNSKWAGDITYIRAASAPLAFEAKVVNEIND